MNSEYITEYISLALIQKQSAKKPFFVCNIKNLSAHRYYIPERTET